MWSVVDDKIRETLSRFNTRWRSFMNLQSWRSPSVRWYVAHFSECLDVPLQFSSLFGVNYNRYRMSVKAFELVPAIERVKLMSDKAKTQVDLDFRIVWFDLSLSPCRYKHRKIKLHCHLIFTLQSTVQTCLFVCLFGFNVALKHLRSYHDGACL